MEKSRRRYKRKMKLVAALAVQILLPAARAKAGRED